MSIVVKGMRMPDNCIKCPMQFGGWCYVSPPEIDERVAPTVDEAAEQGKPKWCPLIEVPEPHGRLIDEGEITAYSYLERNDEEVESLDEFPTVIEAEGK